MREGGVLLVFTRLINKMRWSFASVNFREHILHKVHKKLPNVDVQFRPIPSSTKEDVRIAERILLALKKAEKDEHKTQTGDLWDRIQQERHGDFYEIYHDPIKVAEYMNNMNQHGITHGTGSSSLSIYQALSKYPRLRHEWGVYVKDTMISFAEAVGVLPRNLDKENLYLDEHTVLDSIEEKIGTFTPSAIEGGLYKLKINGKYFDSRDFWSAHLVWRAREIAGSNAAVAEIGGGIGKAALFASQFGIKNYYIYDLPLLNLAQAWYLIKNGVDVVLYGEDARPDCIQILPHWEFAKGSFDITLNADSFPEMDASVVVEYLRIIKKNTRKYLLSINAEEEGVYGDGRKHIVLQDVVKKVGGFKLVYRSPLWFANNYVEELYRW